MTPMDNGMRLIATAAAHNMSLLSLGSTPHKFITLNSLFPLSKIGEVNLEVEKAQFRGKLWLVSWMGKGKYLVNYLHLPTEGIFSSICITIICFLNDNYDAVFQIQEYSIHILKTSFTDF
uniref:Uncharacterized protein n=1 Tax=Megaselia scalaris TaxID=36166 RepID=T1GXB7_MEGSC